MASTIASTRAFFWARVLAPRFAAELRAEAFALRVAAAFWPASERFLAAVARVRAAFCAAAERSTSGVESEPPLKGRVTVETRLPAAWAAPLRSVRGERAMVYGFPFGDAGTRTVVPPAKRTPSSKPRPKPKAVQPPPLTVAVTGPTGDIGRAFLRALDAEQQVAKVVGMARRPFDPQAAGLSKKITYRQGDITDPGSLRECFAGADVVVHLAFIIVGKDSETHEINVRGSRNVFEAAVDAGAKRLIYTSSVAAYGFHDENPQPLTEDTPPKGSESFGYSKQKGELEDVLREVVGDHDIEAYLFRPCIVAGGDALALIRLLPFVQLGQKVPSPLRDAVAKLPGVAPVLPDPGTRFQLVHTDDVASALVAAVKGRGEPGVYNLAAPGEITTSDLARELGWHSVSIPRPSLDVGSALVKRIPMLPAQAEWIQAFRLEVLMSTEKARRELDWIPTFDTLDTLRDTISSAREAGLLAG